MWPKKGGRVRHSYGIGRTGQPENFDLREENLGSRPRSPRGNGAKIRRNLSLYLRYVFLPEFRQQVSATSLLHAIDISDWNSMRALFLEDVSRSFIAIDTDFI